MPARVANQIAHLPPTAALFGAFLGYNPTGVLLPPATLTQRGVSPADQAALLGKSFFPHLIFGPFLDGLHAVFYLSAVLCVIGAVASLLRGQRRRRLLHCTR